MILTCRARAMRWIVSGATGVAAAATIASAQPPATPAPSVGGAARPSITGRFLAEDGTPVAGANVEALVSTFESGRYVLVSEASGQTDDRGEFTLSGLGRGRYYVVASLPAPAGTSAVRYAPTYYPGVSQPQDARTVTVADEGSPPRIEFRATRVPLARVSGRLVASDGRQLLSGALVLAPAEADGVPAFAPSDVRIAADGSFSFGQVPPGRYRVRARGETSADGPALFATFGLIVQGRDVADVVLTLRPGALLEGEVIVDRAHRGRPPAFKSLRVRAPLADGAAFGDPWTGAVHGDGTFVLRGVMAGEHQIVVDGLPATWVVQSVVLRGRDIADDVVDVAEGQQLRGARITITDRTSELTGTVRDRGMPVRDAAVLVYSIAPQFWRPTHRRMRLGRTGADGRFTVRGLPGGDYLAVASTAIDEGDLGRRALLESLRSVATPVTIGGGDARVSVDLPLVTSLPGAPVPTR